MEGGPQFVHAAAQLADAIRVLLAAPDVLQLTGAEAASELLFSSMHLSQHTEHMWVKRACIVLCGASDGLPSLTHCCGLFLLSLLSSALRHLEHHMQNRW